MSVPPYLPDRTKECITPISGTVNPKTGTRYNVNRSSIPPVTGLNSFGIQLPKKRNIMDEDTFIEQTPKTDQKQSSLVDSEEETQIKMDALDIASLKIKEKVTTKLGQSIVENYNKLIKASLNIENRTDKEISREGENISVRDLIAYQIGWGKRVIAWYEAGIHNEKIEMPGDGFTEWSYGTIAKKFYERYQYDYESQQFEEFRFMVKKIIEIVEKEEREGRVNTIGTWDWCKNWSLGKWIDEYTRKNYDEAIQFIIKDGPKLTTKVLF